jgi:hypothetical protein
MHMQALDSHKIKEKNSTCTCREADQRDAVLTAILFQGLAIISMFTACFSAERLVRYGNNKVE